MPQIPKETQQAIEKQARSILNKYGEGSIYQKPGKKDQLQFLYDDETGTKRRKALSIPEGADPQQVKLEFIIKTLTNRYQLQQEQKKRQLLQETISQDFLEKVDKIVEALPETKKTLNPCTKTVSQVVDEYLDYYEKTNVADGTYLTACTQGGKIKRMIGNIKIANITKQDFQNMIYSWNNDVNGKALSKKYVGMIKVLFVNILKYAKDKNYIESYLEIIDNVKLPNNLKEYNSNDKFLEYEELALILFILNTNIKYYTIFTVLTLTGMRSQELFALRKQDLEPEKHRIHIVQALKLSKREKTSDRTYQIGDTKNAISNRYVPATNSVFKLIESYLVYTEQQGIQEKARNLGNSDLIFTDKNGNIINRDSLLRTIELQLRKYSEFNLRHISFHMCRHCFATYLHREHCDLHIIQQCMGHTTKRGSITEIHYIADSKEYINEVMPYLEAVEKKLVDACNEVYNKYK